MKDHIAIKLFAFYQSPNILINLHVMFGFKLTVCDILYKNGEQILCTFSSTNEFFIMKTYRACCAGQLHNFLSIAKYNQIKLQEIFYL